MADNACICAFTRTAVISPSRRYLSFPASSPSSVDKIPMLYPRSGTIFYALTAHKDCRKLSILSYLADIFFVKKKKKTKKKRVSAITEMQSKSTLRFVEGLHFTISQIRRYHELNFPRIFASKCKSDRFPFRLQSHCNRTAVASKRNK